MRSVPIGSEQATNTRVDHMAKTQSPCIFCIVYDFFSVPTHSKWRAARNSLKRTRFYSRTSAEMFLLSPRRCSTLILSLSQPFLFVRKSLEVIFFVSTSRYLSVADIEWCLCCLYFLQGFSGGFIRWIRTHLVSCLPLWLWLALGLWRMRTRTWNFNWSTSKLLTLQETPWCYVITSHWSPWTETQICLKLWIVVSSVYFMKTFSNFRKITQNKTRGFCSSLLWDAVIENVIGWNVKNFRPMSK